MMLPKNKDRQFFGQYENAWSDVWVKDQFHSMLQNQRGWTLGTNRILKSRNNYKGLEFKISGVFSDVINELEAYAKQNSLKELDIWICLYHINSSYSSIINLELSKVSIEPQRIKISFEYRIDRYGEKVIYRIRVLDDCKYKNDIETILSRSQEYLINNFENKLYISYCQENCIKYYNDLIYNEYIRFSEMKKKYEIQLKVLENNVKILENSFFNSDIVMETLERKSRNE